MINGAQSNIVSLVDVVEDFIFKLTKVAVIEQIEKTGDFMVGFCSTYRGATNFHPDISASYGLKVKAVDGDEEEYHLQIECIDYLGDELLSLGYHRDFYLIINNNSSKTWCNFQSEMDVNYHFRNVQIFKKFVKNNGFMDCEEVIENLNKAVFMQKLAG